LVLRSRVLALNPKTLTLLTLTLTLHLLALLTSLSTCYIAVCHFCHNRSWFWSAIPKGPPFRRVRHSESCHSWSLQEIVLDIATTRRLTLTLTVSLTISCHCWKWLKMTEHSEWRPFGMVGRHHRSHALQRMHSKFYDDDDDTTTTRMMTVRMMTMMMMITIMMMARPMLD